MSASQPTDARRAPAAGENRFRPPCSAPPRSKDFPLQQPAPDEIELTRRPRNGPDAELSAPHRPANPAGGSNNGRAVFVLNISASTPISDRLRRSFPHRVSRRRQAGRRDLGASKDETVGVSLQSPAPAVGGLEGAMSPLTLASPRLPAQPPACTPDRQAQAPPEEPIHPSISTHQSTLDADVRPPRSRRPPSRTSPPKSRSSEAETAPMGPPSRHPPLQPSLWDCCRWPPPGAGPAKLEWAARPAGQGSAERFCDGFAVVRDARAPA